jgi:uncharacterized membrane protein
MMGAWPVFGFLGLDVFLVWFAFRSNYRAARAFEEILVTPVRLVWRRVTARGEAHEDTMNPRWVRLETTSDELSGVTRVALTERRITRVIGTFLPPMHKEKLAKSLAHALATAKR